MDVIVISPEIKEQFDRLQYYRDLRDECREEVESLRERLNHRMQSVVDYEGDIAEIERNLSALLIDQEVTELPDPVSGREFQEGDRVRPLRLKSWADDPISDRINFASCGIVNHVDAVGDVQVRWDSQETIYMNPNDITHVEE